MWLSVIRTRYVATTGTETTFSDHLIILLTVTQAYTKVLLPPVANK